MRQHLGPESVDLVYLDPPFNSNKSYNVLFKTQSGVESQAQLEAFDDTWHWSQQAEQQYDELAAGTTSIGVADAIVAMRKLLGTNDVMAYLVMMTARLLELHRVMKPTASLYLHCDPTASHYLKVVMDAIFGAPNFRNEVIWKRTGAHGSAKRWGPIHDVLLFYSKSDAYTWRPLYQPYSVEYLAKFDQVGDRGKYMAITLTGPGTRAGDSGQPWKGVNPTNVGRHWQPSSTAYDVYERLTGENLAALPLQERLDKMDAAGLIWWPKKKDGTPRFKQFLQDVPGVPIQDLVLDIPPIAANAAERLGYPTQKPLLLLERIIASSSNPGDLVLDPFCGCGTAVDAAQKLGREWIGIDVTYLAVDLIRKRLQHTYGLDIQKSYKVYGIPTDVQGAQALFAANPFDFERWAVSLVNGQPNQKQVGDKGVDGRIRFPADKDVFGTVLVSVKGGKQLNPAMVRDLVGTVQQQKGDMGLLITMEPPTKGMAEVANKSGTYVHPLTGNHFPKVQLISVPDLLAHKRPDLPSALLPYIKAKAYAPPTSQQELF